MTICLLICTLTCTAQEPNGFWNHGVGKWLRSADKMLKEQEHRGFDSLYVSVPDRDRMFFVGTNINRQQYNLHLPILLKEDQFPSFFSGYLPSNLSELMYVDPKFLATKADINIGINWRGITIQLPIPLSNYYSKTYSFATNGSRWGVKVSYRTVKNVTGPIMDPYVQLMEHISDNVLYDAKTYNKLQEHHEPLEAKERDIEDGTLDFSTFNAEAYYVFNHRKFSFAAAMSGNKQQKRSAGSAIGMMNYFQTRLGCNEMLNNTRDVFRNQIFSLGVGYGYNLSLMQGRLCLHGSVIPMFSLFNHLVHSSETTPLVYPADQGEKEIMEKLVQLFDVYNTHFYDAVDQEHHSRFKIGTHARLSVNYFFDRYLLSLLFNYRRNTYGNTYETTMKNEEADLRIRLGYRF